MTTAFLPLLEAAAPRLMTRRQAAAYCRIGASAFDDWMTRGILPGPIPGTHRWDKRAIDAALDRASGIAPTMPTSALEEWRAKRARAAQGDQCQPEAAGGRRG